MKTLLITFILATVVFAGISYRLWKSLKFFKGRVEHLQDWCDQLLIGIDDEYRTIFHDFLQARYECSGGGKDGYDGEDDGTGEAAPVD